MYDKTIKKLLFVELMLSVAMMIVTTARITLSIAQRKEKNALSESDDLAKLNELCM